jgi:AcrR family transcriptional regulator
MEAGGQGRSSVPASAAADFAAQIAKACGALPPGPAVEQLRNFCGRTWELLRTPAYAALERQWLTEIYGTIHAMLAGILERGIAAGELRPTDARAAARVILSALVTQAFWCSHPDAFGPAVANGCHRAVADTLSLVLGGLLPAAPDATP